MAQFFAPARRMLLTTSRASPLASTSAYTLSGWTRPVSSSSAKAAQPIHSSAASPSASTSGSQSLRPTTHYRVTLRRSAIGLPERVGRIIAAMGLGKRLSSVYLPQNSSVAGSILAVKELVHVDNVRRLDPPVGRLGEDELQALQDWHDAVQDEDAIWVDAKGDVVDWGREARRAPRGYRVVGNLVSEQRNEQIRQMNTVEAGQQPGEILL